MSQVEPCAVGGCGGGPKSPFPQPVSPGLARVPTSADFVPDHCSVRLVQKNGEYVERCVPDLDLNTISVYQIGGTHKVVRQAVKPARGVNTHAVHDFNVRSGWLDEDSEKERKTESLRTSLSRTKRTLYELAACNPWLFFVTITLDPQRWNRFDPEGLQKAFSDESKRWRNRQVKGVKPYAGYRYLFVPEPHENGAVHVHGFVTLIPEPQLAPYTLGEVNSAAPLPEYVCDKVRAGEPIFHCTEWERLFGWNTVVPIDDPDRAASYITKYITKSLGALDAKTRIWHSRGLQRARLVGQYRVTLPTPYELEQYDTVMSALAARTADGRVLHDKNYIYGSDEKGTLSLVSTVTRINEKDAPLENVMAYLNMNYQHLEDSP